MTIFQWFVMILNVLWCFTCFVMFLNGLWCFKCFVMFLNGVWCFVMIWMVWPGVCTLSWFVCVCDVCSLFTARTFCFRSKLHPREHLPLPRSMHGGRCGTSSWCARECGFRHFIMTSCFWHQAQVFLWQPGSHVPRAATGGNTTESPGRSPGKLTWIDAGWSPVHRGVFP